MRAATASRRTISSSCMINSGEGAQGLASCPCDFYKKWIDDPEDIFGIFFNAP
jgi:hypothetical protein